MHEVKPPIDVELEGDTMTIRVQLGEPTPSKSGKSLILFSSRGFRWFEGEQDDTYGINLTVITRR